MSHDFRVWVLGGQICTPNNIMTAKLNDVDPLAWLADVLTRIAEIPQGRLPELLPWNWNIGQALMAPAA